MNTIANSNLKHKVAGPVVRKSVAMVAVAGRRGDKNAVKRERARHRALMASLP